MHSFSGIEVLIVECPINVVVVVVVVVAVVFAAVVRCTVLIVQEIPLI